MKNATLARVVAVGALCTTLAACGGSSSVDTPLAGNPPPPPAPPPASMFADIAALLSFMKTEVGSMLDNTEPRDVSSFQYPSSETAEPDPGV